MKRMTIAIAAVVVFASGVLLFAYPRPTSGCVFESADGGGDWNDTDSWDLVSGSCAYGYPQSGDTAEITSGNPIKHNVSITCGTLTVKSGGVLTFKAGTTLTIQFNSTCDGDIVGLAPTSPFDDEAIIRDDADVTDETLTISSTGEMRGALTVELKLVNNGLVEADVSEILELSEKAKSGDGEWKASAGNLWVDAAVTGSADWTVTDGEIRIKAFNNGEGQRTGDIVVSGGKFIADAAWSIDGDLTFSGGEIHSCSTCWCMFGENQPG